MLYIFVGHFKGRLFIGSPSNILFSLASSAFLASLPLWLPNALSTWPNCLKTPTTCPSHYSKWHPPPPPPPSTTPAKKKGERLLQKKGGEREKESFGVWKAASYCLALKCMLCFCGCVRLEMNILGSIHIHNARTASTNPLPLLLQAFHSQGFSFSQWHSHQ